MSLKAKIEAVIYAAEEPVTLAQLAGLFAEEALEEKRLREAAEAEAAIASEVEATPVEEAASSTEEVEEAAPPAEDVPAVEEASETEETAEPSAAHPSEASAGMTGPSEDTAVPTAEDEKKAARQREREIRDEIRRLLQELMADYSTGDRGMEIREIAGGFRVGTKPEYHDAVRSFVKSLKPPMKLSLQALETLAVIAYKQPITAPEVGEIRGVDSAGVIGSLISRKLVTTAGRKQVIGRPILYKTSKEFLLRFGLKDINELPSMEEFEKMAADELAEPGELPFEEQTQPATGVEEPGAIEEAAEDDAEALEQAQSEVEIADDSAEEDADIPGVAISLEVLEEANSEENGEEEEEPAGNTESAL